MRREPEALQHLERMPWTGNIRELRNVMERLIILSADTITLADVKRYAESPFCDHRAVQG